METIDQILANKESLAMAILADVDAHYNQHSQIYIEKSLRDIRYSILFTVEGIRLKNPTIIISYYQWLIETLKNYQIDEETIEKMFESIKMHFKKYMNDEQMSFLESISFDSFRVESAELILNPYQDVYDDYIKALLNKSRTEAKRVIDQALKNRVSVKDIYVHVLQNAMYEIGHLWQTGNISVADEHLATVITQYIITTLYSAIFGTPKNGKKMVSCAIGQELHEIGIRMVTDFFEMEGFETQYLGSNLPPEDFIGFVKEYKPDLIALSATLPIHLSTLRETIQAIRQEEEVKDIKILVGGQAFIGQPELYKLLNADGFASNAMDAIKVGERLVREPDESFSIGD
jgi:MerR family transcriptional regulator, light-induced transcriptional regulator